MTLTALGTSIVVVMLVVLLVVKLVVVEVYMPVFVLVAMLIDNINSCGYAASETSFTPVLVYIHHQAVIFYRISIDIYRS